MQMALPAESILGRVLPYSLFESNSRIGHEGQCRFTEKTSSNSEGKSLCLSQGSIPFAAAVGSDEPVFYHNDHPTSPSAKSSIGSAHFRGLFNWVVQWFDVACSALDKSKSRELSESAALSQLLDVQGLEPAFVEQFLKIAVFLPHPRLRR